MFLRQSIKRGLLITIPVAILCWFFYKFCELILEIGWKPLLYPTLESSFWSMFAHYGVNCANIALNILLLCLFATFVGWAAERTRVKACIANIKKIALGEPKIPRTEGAEAYIQFWMFAFLVVVTGEIEINGAQYYSCFFASVPAPFTGWCFAARKENVFFTNRSSAAYVRTIASYGANMPSVENVQASSAPPA